MRQTYHGNSWVAANVMAAQERHQADIASMDQRHLLREAGITRAGRPPRFAAIRMSLGALLIRTGERLRGAATRPANTLPVYGR